LWNQIYLWSQVNKFDFSNLIAIVLYKIYQFNISDLIVIVLYKINKFNINFPGKETERKTKDWYDEWIDGGFLWGRWKEELKIERDGNVGFLRPVIWQNTKEELKIERDGNVGFLRPVIWQNTKESINKFHYFVVPSRNFSRSVYEPCSRNMHQLNSLFVRCYIVAYRILLRWYFSSLVCELDCVVL